MAYRNPDGTPDQGSNLYHFQRSANATTKLTNYQSGSAFFGVIRVSYPGSGTLVAYTVLDSDYPFEEQVRIFDTATGADRLVDTYTDECYTPCLQAVHLTRDGIVFYAVNTKNFPFYSLKADGSGRTDMNVYQARIAPSGQRIISDNGKVVFTSSAPNGPTTTPAATDVYIMNLDGTSVQPVTHLKPPQTASEAVISADGTRVAFTLAQGFIFNDDGTIMPPTEASEIWTVRTDGTDLHRISIGDSGADNPSISADGAWVTYSQDNQVRKMTTHSDMLALIHPIDLTSLSISYPSNQVISADAQQTAVALNESAIYLAQSGDFIVRWTGLAGLTRVYAPRVITSYNIRSAGNTAEPSIGSLMSVYGTNLGDEELTVVTAFPFPTTLGGVELTMNGTLLPLQATTPWQINAQIPQSAMPGEAAFIARGGTNNTTAEVHTEVLARDPEAIPFDLAHGQAAAVYPGTKIVADKDHPASPGQILEIYSLGLGLTTPRTAAGEASPANPPATTDILPRIRIGDRDAEILFSGLVPGLAGVYQVNIRMPSGITPNPNTPGQQLLTWVNADGSLSGTTAIYVKE